MCLCAVLPFATSEKQYWKQTERSMDRRTKITFHFRYIFADRKFLHYIRWQKVCPQTVFNWFIPRWIPLGNVITEKGTGTAMSECRNRTHKNSRDKYVYFGRIGQKKKKNSIESNTPATEEDVSIESKRCRR